MKYIKRAVTIVEAMQFTEMNKDRVFGWASEIQMNIYPSRDKCMFPTLIIPTIHGEDVCGIGDYLVESICNDRRCIKLYKQKTFEHDYRPELPPPVHATERYNGVVEFSPIEGGISIPDTKTFEKDLPLIHSLESDAGILASVIKQYLTNPMVKESIDGFMSTILQDYERSRNFNIHVNTCNNRKENKNE